MYDLGIFARSLRIEQEGLINGCKRSSRMRMTSTWTWTFHCRLLDSLSLLVSEWAMPATRA